MTHEKSDASALHVVLQWLCYVFWFWTLLIISIILSSVLSYFLIDRFDPTWLTYVSSSLLILLPAAYVTDHYYSKVEPSKKHGFAAVVMVVNAVIACVAVVASLITLMVTLVGLAIDTGSTDSKLVIIISSLIVASMSLLFFLRIIKVDRLRGMNRNFTRIISGIVALTLTLVIVGPLINAAQRKNDRFIEENYYSVRRQISNYVTENNRLPNSFDDVGFTDNAKKVVETGRLTYEKGEKVSSEESSIYTSTARTRSEFFYTICVVWDYEKESPAIYYSDADDFRGYHDSGTECYEETTYTY